MDFREYDISWDDGEVLVTGTIHEPVTWDFSIRISPDDIPGMLRVGLNRATFRLTLDWVLRRSPGQRPGAESTGARVPAPTREQTRRGVRERAAPRMLAPTPADDATPLVEGVLEAALDDPAVSLEQRSDAPPAATPPPSPPVELQIVAIEEAQHELPDETPPEPPAGEAPAAEPSAAPSAAVHRRSSRRQRYHVAESAPAPAAGTDGAQPEPARTGTESR